MSSAKFLSVLVSLLVVAGLSYGQDRLEPAADGRLGLSLTIDYLPHYKVDDGGQDFGWLMSNLSLDRATVTTDPTVGTRYSLDYRLPQGWDVGLIWMETNAKGTAGVSSDKGLITPDLFVFSPSCSHAYASLDIGVETRTIEVGRQVPLAAGADLRLYGGLEQLAVSRDVFTAYREDSSGDNFFNAQEANFDGWGVRVGLQNTIGLVQGLGLYSQLGLGMISGDTDLSQTITVSGGGSASSLHNTRLSTNVTAYEVAAGLAYKQKLGGAAAVTAKLGYEYTKMSGLVKAPQYGSDLFFFNNTTYDLTMSGVAAGLTVSF